MVQLMERNEQTINPDDSPLHFLLSKCNISLEDAKSEIDDMNNKKYLENHTFNIWQGTDGRWRTYLPDDRQKKQTEAYRKGKPRKTG